jgi:hypothetical protein
MDKRSFSIVVAALLGATVAAAWAVQPAGGKGGEVLVPVTERSASLKKLLYSRFSKEALAAGTYVGPEFCISCHQDKGDCRESKHTQALRRPMPQYNMVSGKGVVNDYDQNGIDDFTQGLNFNTVNSAFDPYKPNAPILGYSNETYTITIGQLTMAIVCTQGGTGDWKQRYLVRIPVTDTSSHLTADNYVSPVQYNETTHEYVLYNATNWYDGAKLPKFGPTTTVSQVLSGAIGASYSKNCIGCHTTGLRSLGTNAQGEWIYKAYVASLYYEDDPAYFDYDHDGLYDIVNVTCESCHGPGSKHILGSGDPTKIVNPAELTPDKGNEVCGQCHTRVRSVPGGKHEWPIKDDTETPYFPGSVEPLSNFYTYDEGEWPDGVTSKKHHQQYPDFFASAHPSNPYNKLTCFTCHDSHGPTANKHQIVESVQSGTLTIPTADTNDTLCLSCHAGFGPFAGITQAQIADYANNRDAIGAKVTSHTNHYYNPEGSLGVSRCSTCHMPTAAVSGISYDIRSHTFEVISPAKTLNYQAQGGMPSACAVMCHSGRPLNTIKADVCDTYTKWNEATDVYTATYLQKYFGPGGLWWNTTPSASASYRWFMKSLAPGEQPASTATADDNLD